MQYYKITPGILFGMFWPSCEEITDVEAAGHTDNPNVETSQEGNCCFLRDEDTFVALAASTSEAKELAKRLNREVKDSEEDDRDDYGDDDDEPGGYTGERWD